VSEQDAAQEVMKSTEGYGCDICLEATGNPDAVIQGLQMIRKLGRFVEFSILREEQVQQDIVSMLNGSALNPTKNVLELRNP
jgi:threonine dehydrogenase-like Zn-dependent dehydrogenase